MVALRLSSQLRGAGRILAPNTHCSNASSIKPRASLRRSPPPCAREASASRRPPWRRSPAPQCSGSHSHSGSAKEKPGHSPKSHPTYSTNCCTKPERQPGQEVPIASRMRPLEPRKGTVAPTIIHRTHVLARQVLLLRRHRLRRRLPYEPKAAAIPRIGAESVLTHAASQLIYLRKLPPGPRSPRSTRAPIRSSAWSWPASSSRADERPLTWDFSGLTSGLMRAASDRCDRLHPRCQAAVRTSPDWRQVRAGHDVHPWRAGHRRDLRTGLSAQSFTPASEFVGIIRAAVLVPRV